MADARFQSGSDLMASWRDSVLSGAAPILYPLGTGDIGRIELGPGLVLLLGGAPGAGKTCFVMQTVLDALRITPSLRAVVCNVEMPPAVLLDRQLARLSGIDLTTIRYRRFGTEHADRLDQAMCTLEPLAERLAFVRPPFDLGNIALTADAFDAGLLVLDYVQRIPPPGEHPDQRGRLGATMDYLRQFADAGCAVIVVSAVGRSKDSKGRSSYAGDALTLASFRESSELEFGADDAWMLTPDENQDDAVTLRHLKSRHGETKDLTLTFNRRVQRFTSAAEPAPRPDGRKLKSALAALWNRTAAAGDDEEDPT